MKDDYLLQRIKRHNQAVQHTYQQRREQALKLLSGDSLYAPRPTINGVQPVIIQPSPSLVSYEWAVQENWELCVSVGHIPGVKNEVRLHYALEAPLMGYLRTLEEQAADVVEKIVLGHCFHDGNKRTATACMYEFLKRNGYMLYAHASDVHDAVLCIVNHQLCRAEMAQFISENLRRI